MTLIKRFYIGLAAFLFVLGSVGAIELSQIGIGQGIIQICLGFAGMLFAKEFAW